jgi:hypothetical protein
MKEEHTFWNAYKKIIFTTKICHTKSVASEALHKKYVANFLLVPIVGKENKCIYITISVFNTDRI